MIKKMLVTAAGAFAVSAVCLAAAAALVGNDLRTKGWDINLVKVGDDLHFVRGDAAKAEPTADATLPWPGGDRLAIDLPGHVVYTQGPTASVSVSGPKRLVGRVRLDAGRLYLAPGPDTTASIHIGIDHGHVHASGPDTSLSVTIVAPSVTAFAVSGDSDLSVHNYAQPALDIALNGSGDIDADGHTSTLKLEQSGSGAVDLSSLDVRDADISLSGSGNAEVHASGRAQVGISGSGSVALTIKPASLTTSISGSGSVNQDY
jgi:hypothetical protein